jgi:hypothetical protein
MLAIDISGSGRYRENMKGDKLMINGFEKVGRTLYRANRKYYRLYGKGITPNGCWVIAPKLREITDIDAGTGNDIYSGNFITLDVTGTVSASNEYITEED